MQELLFKGKRYDLVVGLQDARRQLQFRNVVYRGKLKLKGVTYEHFEGELVHELVEPDDIREVREVRARYEI
jgi:hypothetical protein